MKPDSPSHVVPYLDAIVRRRDEEQLAKNNNDEKYNIALFIMTCFFRNYKHNSWIVTSRVIFRIPLLHRKRSLNPNQKF